MLEHNFVERKHVKIASIKKPMYRTIDRTPVFTFNTQLLHVRMITVAQKHESKTVEVKGNP